MEATGEELGLLSKIRPPRLEDAGLEDCALPPDSIHQAFLKAAASVGSRAARAASILTGDDADVSDPWPEKPPPSDVLVGIEPEASPPGPCTTGKGGALADSARDVMVGERNEGEMIENKDDLVIVGEKGGEKEGEDCVDGLSGLKIKDKDNKEDDDEDGNGDNNKKPTLVEGFF